MWCDHHRGQNGIRTGPEHRGEDSEGGATSGGTFWYRYHTNLPGAPFDTSRIRIGFGLYKIHHTRCPSQNSHLVISAGLLRLLLRIRYFRPGPMSILPQSIFNLWISIE